MAERAVAWTDVARHDLEAIVDYIAEERPLNALSVLARLECRAETLTLLSTRGRQVPELRGLGLDQYRELIETPWRILYRIEARRIVVMAVFDGRRDLQTVLLERLVRPRG